ncbi:MAG: EAL domain-containing protein [Herpetosiphonaceae bacterium]|nr:EAL domain-containing protein [Herpetosiphonaceae bacterium]
MTRPTTLSLSEKAQLARLEQFLRWAVPFDFIFACLQVVAFVGLGDRATGSTAATMFGYGGILLVARAQTRNGRLHRAVATTSCGLFAADIIIAVLQPILFPTLIIVPLLAVAVALPYIGGRALRLLISVAELVTGIVVICGMFVPWRSHLPPWFVSAFLVASLLAVVALVLLLLWQFSSRLADTLARTQAAEERYSLAARGANDGLWDWNLITNEVYYSTRWKEMMGCGEADIGTSPEEWFGRVHPEERTRVKAEIGVHCDGLTPHFESEHRMLDASGRYRWVLSRGLAVFDVGGKATRVAGSQTDVTVRKQVEEQLLHDALHDALTGLPNRVLFMKRLGRAVKRARRHPEYRFAVLFLDLDRFKVVNDSLGHTAGDALLVDLGRRLLAGVRPDDTVARLSGDEFGILLEGISDLHFAMMAADRLQARMAEPFVLQGNKLFSAISMGIAYSAAEYEQPEEVLRDADIALYRAKAMGRARYVVFTHSMHVRAVELLQLEIDLRRAIEREEFVVYYQPIVSLKTDQITGFEALVRWQHPERGLLEPGEFITVAEETGLIAPLGWLVLREACHQMRVWHVGFPEYPPLTMNVNFSGTQFAHPDLRRHFEAIFHDIVMDAGRLRLEITETVMMEHAGSHADVLAYLRSLDIQLHVDDFGTGYSSLGALDQFPISALKIDRLFVMRLGANGEHGELLETIITLAHNLRIEVIAEGVETVAQREYLRMLGCDYGQGYLFSPAVDARGASALLARAVDREMQASPLPQGR